MRRNKGQASWDCLFLESEDKAFLEALEQIPTDVAGAGTRLYDDPSVEGRLSIQPLPWEAVRGKGVCGGSQAPAQQSATLCASRGIYDLFLHT